MAAKTIVLVGKSGKKHSFVPVTGEREELLRHARHLGEEVAKVEELTYNPQGRNPWNRVERPDLLALLEAKEEKGEG